MLIEFDCEAHAGDGLVAFVCELDDERSTLFGKIEDSAGKS